MSAARQHRDQLQSHNLSIEGIDFDPQGQPVQSGDSEDPEFTATVADDSGTVAVSTPNPFSRLMIGL